MNNYRTSGLDSVHPAALLGEIVLPEVSKSKVDTAKSLGISRAQRYLLLEEQAPVTAAVVLRLCRFFRNGLELWLNLRSIYHLAVPNAELADEPATIASRPAT